MNRIIDEPMFRISEDSIQVKQMDPNRVAMIDYSISKAHFEAWNVHTSGVFCFNLDEALKVIPFKRLSKNTRISIFFDGKDGKVTFTLEDHRVRQRTLVMLEPDTEFPPHPKINYDATVKMVTKQLKEDLEDIKKVSDHVTFRVDSTGLTAEAIGETAKAKNTYAKGSDTLLALEVKEDCRAVFSLGYLPELLFDPKLCDVVGVHLSTDMPIKTTMFSKVGELYGWLAPRIETE